MVKATVPFLMATVPLVKATVPLVKAKVSLVKATVPWYSLNYNHKVLLWVHARFTVSIMVSLNSVKSQNANS